MPPRARPNGWRRRMKDDPRQHRFTLVFDREAYSPEFFAEMKQRRIAVLS